MYFVNRVLCETIKDFSIRAADTSLGQGDKEFSTKCQILKEKLDMLLCTLQDEELALVHPKSQVFVYKYSQCMCGSLNFYFH